MINMVPNATALWARASYRDHHGAVIEWIGRVVGWVPQPAAVGDGWLPVVTREPRPAVEPVPSIAQVTYATTARALAEEGWPWWSDPAYAASDNIIMALDSTVGTSEDGVTLSDLRAILDELPEGHRLSRSMFLGALDDLHRQGLVTVDRSRVALTEAGASPASTPTR